MSDYRTVKCSIYAQDEWFMDLPIDGKFLWIYLFTNSHASVAGIYKLPIKTIVFETGIASERVLELLSLFSNEHKAMYANGIVWVTKMREHQATASPKVLKRIIADLEIIPDSPLKQEYLRKYSTDTVSIPYQTQEVPYLELESETETETETETATVAATVSKKPAYVTVQDAMVRQWEAVFGMMATPTFADAQPYMKKLYQRDAIDWWQLAISETAKADARAAWSYMKSILERWLAAGKTTSAQTASKNGTDPSKPKTVKIQDPVTGEIKEVPA